MVLTEVYIIAMAIIFLAPYKEDLWKTGLQYTVVVLIWICFMILGLVAFISTLVNIVI